MRAAHMTAGDTSIVLHICRRFVHTYDRYVCNNTERVCVLGNLAQNLETTNSFLFAV